MPELDWSVDPNADTPPSKQLVERVLDALAAGDLAAGDRLPSVRQLASAALVNHNTTARAYRDLEQLGVVRGENGLGVFVTGDGPRLGLELRRGSTIERFRGSAEQALRAGHPLSELVAALLKLSGSTSATRRSA